MASTVAASRKHVELSLELKRKLIHEHEHGVPFTLLGKKYHIATSTAANIWRKKDFFLRSRMSGSRKRCNDRSKYKIVNQVTALFVKSMLERNHKIDGEVIKRFARTAAAQCNFKDFHGSNGWLDSFKKRENVCWVRRRGGAAPGPAGQALAVLSASAGEHLEQQQHQQQHQQHQQHQHQHQHQHQQQLQQQHSVVAAGPLALSSSVMAALEQRRSDSPNLSTAAAAAAVAATAAAEHHHHHHGAPGSGQAPGNGGQEQSLAARDQHCHSPSSSSAASHCCWEEESCPRCTVAAAAAAIAALNSSDSIHERDHEIEDWFHGIPFLCQFFEEYQSMHQAGEGGAPVGQPGVASTSAGAGALDTDAHQPQRAASFNCSLAESPPQSSSASSTCSSSQALAISSSTGSMAMLCGGPATGAHSSSADLELTEHAFRNQLQQQQQHAQITRSQSSSSSSPTSTSGAFRPSASMVNVQLLDQKPVFVKQQSAAGYAQPVDGYAPAATDQLDSQEHLMEINYTDSASGAADRQQQLMDCMLVGAARADSDASGANSAQSNAPMLTTDYNSSDNDQEFYLAMPSQQQAQHCRAPAQHEYVTVHDAQSQDELLVTYHNEISKHADHCCHYEQAGAVQLALAGVPSNACGQHRQTGEQQQALVAQYQQQESAPVALCYMDEYEYENISTIRHYPLPPMAQLAHSAQFSAAATAAANAQGAPFDSDGERASDARPAAQQQRARQLDECQRAVDSAPFASVSQQQQTLSNLSPSSSSSRLASATSSPSSFANAAGALSGADASAGFQAQQQQRAQSQAQQQQQQPQDYGALLLYEHEQTIEHADHEEHNLLHNALMRSPEKLKLIDSIITLLNYASNYNQKMLAPLLEIKRCIERDLEVVLSDTSAAAAAAAAAASGVSTSSAASGGGAAATATASSVVPASTPSSVSAHAAHCCASGNASALRNPSGASLVVETSNRRRCQGQQVVIESHQQCQQQLTAASRDSSLISSPQHNLQVECSSVARTMQQTLADVEISQCSSNNNTSNNSEMLEIEC